LFPLDRLDDFAGRTSLGIGSTEVFADRSGPGERIAFLEKFPDGSRAFYSYSLPDSFFIPDNYPRRTYLNALGITVACITGIFDHGNGDLWNSLHLNSNVRSSGVKDSQAFPRTGKLAQSTPYTSLGDNINPLYFSPEYAMGTGVSALITEGAGAW
jgi:hypothetical protein